MLLYSDSYVDFDGVIGPVEGNVLSINLSKLSTANTEYKVSICLRWNRTRVDGQSDVRIVHSNEDATLGIGMIIVCSVTVNLSQSQLNPKTFDIGSGSNTATLDYVYSLAPDECDTRVNELLRVKYVNNVAPITSIVANQASGV